MNCSHCGGILKDQFVKFCPHCGKKLQSENISSETRLQRALVPKMIEDKNNPKKSYIQFKIDGNDSGFNYSNSMYIKIRNPLEFYRKRWKNEISNYIIVNSATTSSYFNYKKETITFFNQEKENFINEVLTSITEQINQWPNFVRDTYRDAIVEHIRFKKLKDLIKKLDCDQMQNDFEEIASGMHTSFEHRKHSQAFRSVAGFGLAGSVKGAAVAEAANYALDAAGTIIEYASHVKENMEAKEFLDNMVPYLVDSLFISCDKAANIVLNYCVSHLMALCKLPSIDSTSSITTEEFNKSVLKSRYLPKPESFYVSNACQLLSERPYDLSVINWIYNIDPTLDVDLLNYGVILGIEDEVTDLVENAERERSTKKDPFNPLKKNYDGYYIVNFYKN